MLHRWIWFTWTIISQPIIGRSCC